MKFSKKTAHRSIVSLAMLAPVIYLFGAMFLGLAGAHGEQIYAEPVYVDEYVPVDDFGIEGDYRLSIGGVRPYFVSADFATRTFNFPYTYLDTNRNYVSFFTYQSTRYMTFGVDGGSYSDIASYNPSTDVYREFVSSPWVLSVDVSASSFVSFLADNVIDYSLSLLTSVPSSVVPENAGAYTELIFGNFFPKDNFLERVGANALSANPVGFAPFGTFLSYLDVNVFHASGSQVALMLYGMVYWSLHVIIADLVYHVAVFIPNLIQRVFDWFGQKGLDDD